MACYSKVGDVDVPQLILLKYTSLTINYNGSILFHLILGKRLVMTTSCCCPPQKLKQNLH